MKTLTLTVRVRWLIEIDADVDGDRFVSSQAKARSIDCFILLFRLFACIMNRQDVSVAYDVLVVVVMMMANCQLLMRISALSFLLT